MKYIVVLSIAVFCAYQLISIQAAPNSRQKRYVSHGSCPENTTTADECTNYLRQSDSGPTCIDVLTDGKIYQVLGYGSIQCFIDGRELNLTQDFSKPYPHCCPGCDFTNIELPKEA